MEWLNKEIDMTITELSKLMNQPESDVLSFVECLRVWMEKGYSIEESIKRHMAQMTRFAENSLKLPKSIVVDAFYG